MSSGPNFRLAVATRGFRGGGLGTRYVDEQLTTYSFSNAVSVALSQDTYSVAVDSHQSVTANIEVQSFTADIYEVD